MANVFEKPQQAGFLEKLGTILGGFGAGYQGRGTQFLQQQQAQRQQLSLERQKAAAEDMLKAKRLIEEGRLEDLRDLGFDRARMIEELGGDSSDTRRIIDLTNYAMLGDKNSLDTLNSEINDGLYMAQQQGLIKGAPVQEWQDVIENGRVVGQKSRVSGEMKYLANRPEEQKEDAYKIKQDAFKNLQSIIKNAKADKRVDNFIGTTSSLDRILSVQPTAAGDLSLVFAYMKMLDPTSVVREGEQAMAKNAAGVPDQVRNTYNQLLTGQTLTPEQREEFKNQAQMIYEASKQTAQIALLPYTERAKKMGFSYSDVYNSVFGKPLPDGAPEGSRWSNDGESIITPNGDVYRIE